MFTCSLIRSLEWMANLIVHSKLCFSSLQPDIFDVMLLWPQSPFFNQKKGFHGTGGGTHIELGLRISSAVQVGHGVKSYIFA